MISYLFCWSRPEEVHYKSRRRAALLVHALDEGERLVELISRAQAVSAVVKVLTPGCNPRCSICRMRNIT